MAIPPSGLKNFVFCLKSSLFHFSGKKKSGPQFFFFSSAISFTLRPLKGQPLFPRESKGPRECISGLYFTLCVHLSILESKIDFFSKISASKEVFLAPTSCPEMAGVEWAYRVENRFNRVSWIRRYDQEPRLAKSGRSAKRYGHFERFWIWIQGRNVRFTETCLGFA